MIDNVRISKKVFYPAILVIILAALAVAYFVSFSGEEIVGEVSLTDQYKKVLYDGTLCQYACPLSYRTIEGELMLVPSSECSDACLADFRSNSLSNFQYSEEDLMNDDLIPDVERAIVNCRSENLDQEGVLDNENFFACSAEGLENLKMRYEYLN